MNIARVACILLAWVLLPSALLTHGAPAGMEPRKTVSSEESAVLLARGDALVAQIRARVLALQVGEVHPLFRRHLRTTEALARTGWIRAVLLAQEDPETAQETVGLLQKILDGLNADAGRWDSYAAGKRSLILGLSARIDKTLQPYSLRLPRDWQPDQPYPLIVYLHGHVPDPSQLWYAGWSFSPDPPVMPAEEEALDPHVVVAPWGHGNAGYTGAGEMDVWRAIEDAGKICRLDPDRRVLTGHSMGAYGTWSIGARTPDTWAALALYAGGTRPGEAALAGNLANTPVLLWHGAQDRTVPVERTYAMRDALQQYGNKAHVFINPDAGHMVPRGERTPHKVWLLQQRRHRPARFQFIADERHHGGAWGIVLPRALSLPLPGFTCRVEDNTVHIDSRNADGLDVRLGDGGLGLSGEVTVFWNGDQVYRGPVADSELGKGSGRRHQRF